MNTNEKIVIKVIVPLKSDNTVISANEFDLDTIREGSIQFPFKLREIDWFGEPINSANNDLCNFGLIDIKIQNKD